MKNEIKVGEYIRTQKGEIGKIIKIKNDDEYSYDYYVCDNDSATSFRMQIVKHSPNIIDLIEVGDYVNGYKVVETYKDKQLSGWQVGKSKEDETWLGVVVSSKMIKEPLQEYFDNEMIKTVVTKEQFESISYKVTKM